MARHDLICGRIPVVRLLAPHKDGKQTSGKVALAGTGQIEVSLIAPHKERAVLAARVSAEFEKCIVVSIQDGQV